MIVDISEDVMSRVQLALNVSDLEGSIAFYSAFFGVEPHKRRPGYANFAVAEPPLKLLGPLVPMMMFPFQPAATYLPCGVR